MEYNSLIKDFAYRTRKNLELLEERQRTNADSEYYEVTQLINSLLGLLVFPQQRYFELIPTKSIEQLMNEGWPIPQTMGDYQQAADLRELMRYFRNAISHCNIEFPSDLKNQICGIRVWNLRRGQVTWKAELPIKDLEKFTKKFISLLIEER
ncbi:MAG: hypothetical protein H6756_04280 [Candidatus Omnitrophica bacterium]|nr:hypothetical protein [Candidatus Omnitrophota bacterium]